MKLSPVLSTAFLTTLVLATAQAREAGTDTNYSPVQRCDAGDGNSIYTDKPCAVLRARPARMSDDLAFRIAMTNAHQAASQELALGAYRDASEPLQAIPAGTGRRSAAAGCARSPEQLSRDLVGAFALHDVNRVAESYHWAGMSQRQSVPVMKQLERLSAKPLADARFLSAWIGSGEQAAATIPSDAGLMQLVFAGNGARTMDFEVRRQSGCYFISSPMMS
ncbi:hypothetical protein ACFPOA_14985 [Lysobacter niabensis]|uniref:hypothetical protein n=1 Tax=Agrilutibacter niabensis TaxID=380628 RepID=UPI00361DACAA